MPSEVPSMERASKPLLMLFGVAAFVIVVAGMRAAADIITPVLLAGFLAIIFAPPLFKLRERRVPTLIALLLLAVPVVVGILLVTLLLQASFASFQSNLDVYETRLQERKQELIESLRELGVEIPNDITFGELDPRQTRRWATMAISAFSGLLTSAFLVVILLLLMLLETAGLTEKLQALRAESDELIRRCRQILISVRYYLLLKTAVSAVTGVAAFLLLLAFGVEFPLLWGFLAFLLNYIPNIGSIIAAIPPVLLAFILDGGGAAIGVAIGYLAINTLVGNVLEPMWMGKGIGLSTLVVFLSLLFWSWVLGPIGALLSIPLTMTCKTVLEGDPSTRWIAVMLGPIDAAAEAGSR